MPYVRQSAIARGSRLSSLFRSPRQTGLECEPPGTPPLSRHASRRRGHWRFPEPRVGALTSPLALHCLLPALPPLRPARVVGHDIRASAPPAVPSSTTPARVVEAFVCLG